MFIKELFTMLCSDEDGQTWTKSEIITAISFVGVLTIMSIIL